MMNLFNGIEPIAVIVDENECSHSPVPIWGWVDKGEFRNWTSAAMEFPDIS